MIYCRYCGFRIEKRMIGWTHRWSVRNRVGYKIHRARPALEEQP